MRARLVIPWLLPLLLLLAARREALPAPRQGEAAVRVAAEAQRLYQAQRYEEALEKFRQAYDAYPSPDLHVYVAASLLSLHREREAVQALVEFFADLPGTKEELRGLALRLWQEAAGARERLLAAGVAGLPPGAGRRLQRLPSSAREALPPELKGLLVAVTLSVWPPDATVLVDGDPLQLQGAVLPLLRGRHRLRVLPPPASDYLSREVSIEARAGMEPLSLRLELGLRLRAPLGTRLYVDGKEVAADRASGLTVEAASPVAPGPHHILGVSPRGRRQERRVELVPGASRDVVLQPPPLWPGLALGGAGLAVLAIGAGVLAADDTCASPGDIEHCELVYRTAPGGGVTLALGVAALGAGVIWFAYSAIDHPRFRRGPRPALAPSGGGAATLWRF